MPIKRLKQKFFLGSQLAKNKNHTKENADNFQIVSFSIAAFYQNTIIKNCQFTKMHEVQKRGLGISPKCKKVKSLFVVVTYK
ncbi:Uncharacterised protein [Streptococcus agalactiae]|nr:Uncharacterised protein [Streptococcus agalactiae]